jgi:hypothetical protein
VSRAGSESFVVDPQGINARSLRGIGRSSLALSIAATQLDFVAFDKFVADDAVFYLPDGTVHSKNDPQLRDFNLSFRFAPGVDVNTISDVSSLSLTYASCWRLLFLFLWVPSDGGVLADLCNACVVGVR